ncbi:unnamed protein product [Thelazia callipaeda]|uniref:RAP domain-containing protein n=1 Tax=Thelazia callipaeda TaxID=103827 RepID=A0A0N5CPX2_THECL|nr:unnamed protein product [Thelazia callipaeda]
MPAFRSPLLFLRRLLNCHTLGAHLCEIPVSSNVIKDRFYPTRAVPNANVNNLDLLITNLAQENCAEVTEVSKVTSVEYLKKICSRLKQPISTDISVKILSRFAELANEVGDIQLIIDYIKTGLLVELEKTLKTEQLNINSTVEAMSAVISLKLFEDPIFDTLIASLQRHFSTDLFSASVSPIIRLALLLSKNKVQLPDDLSQKMREWLQLKASEIIEPKDIVSVIICWNKNDRWFNMFVERAKGSISLMSLSELVDLIASLANNSSRPPHILRLICSALEQNKGNLMVNPLITLAKSAAKLQLMDGRIRRIIADQVVSNMESVSKWSQINAIVDPMAKLRIGHIQAWSTVATWMKNNLGSATTAELSYAVHWCAIAGKGDLIQDAARHLCKMLISTSITNSSKALLSSVYALAICDQLSPQLSQIILQPSFVTNILEGLTGFRKLMVITTIAQIQLYVKKFLSTSCERTFVNISDLMQLSSIAVNDMALKLRYGKSEEANVAYFHSLLHKLVPVNSHTLPPNLTEDGIFINALVKLDIEENRFVPLNHFSNSKVPHLAVIYLSWKDRVSPCNDFDKAALVGPILLNSRLLKAKGFVPVFFSQDDFDSSAPLKKQFAVIKAKLEEAANVNQ